MKLKNWILAAGCVMPGIFYACTKNATPQPPVHDTVIVHKTDTLRISIVPDTPNLKNGLVLYLPFNGSFADSSGNNNSTMSVNGASLAFDQHGYSNSAFSASGSGERILVTNNGSIKFDTAYSISLDFMVRISGLQALFTMVAIANGNGPTFIVGTLPNGTLYMGANDSTAGCDNIGSTTDPRRIFDSTTFVPQPESWYNAVFVYHKGSVQIYVNGKLISTKTGTGTRALLCPASQLVVGAWWNGDPLSLNGKMDEVRLYNRVLTAQEITYLARNFQPGSTKINPALKTR